MCSNRKSWIPTVDFDDSRIAALVQLCIEPAAPNECPRWVETCHSLPAGIGGKRPQADFVELIGDREALAVQEPASFSPNQKADIA